MRANASELDCSFETNLFVSSQICSLVQERDLVFRIGCLQKKRIFCLIFLVAFRLPHYEKRDEKIRNKNANITQVSTEINGMDARPQREKK